MANHKKLNTSGVFYINGWVQNLDGFIPAQGCFFLPKMLPEGNPISYQVAMDPSMNAYWVSAVPSSWTVDNSFTQNTLQDPAILHIGKVPTASKRTTPVPEITISEASIQEVVFKEKPSVVSKTNDPILLETSSTHLSQECFEEEGKVTSHTDALDLAEPSPGSHNIVALDYLDLAFIKDQEANLVTRLLAVDNGRLATVAQTLAEAYAENAKDLEMSGNVDHYADQAQLTQLAPYEFVKARFDEACVCQAEVRDISQPCFTDCVEARESCLFEDNSRLIVSVTLPKPDSDRRQHLFNSSSIPNVEPLMVEAKSCGVLKDHLSGDVSNAERPAVSLPERDSDRRQPLVTISPMPCTEIVAVGATFSSHVVLNFTRGPRKANIDLGKPFNDEKGIARPVVASPEQVYARQLSDGNASTTTVESLAEQIYSRQTSDGNVSITTIGSEMAEAANSGTTDPSRAYPQPHVRIEVPYVATTEPPPSGSKHVQSNEVSVGSSLSTFGQAEPEMEKLSKSQKKRRRQGRKRRALATAVAQQTTADQATDAPHASTQPELDEQSAKTEVNHEADGQSLGPILEDPIVPPCEHSPIAVTASATVTALTVSSTQSIHIDESQVEGPPPPAAVSVAQPSNAESPDHTNTAFGDQHTPLVVDTAHTTDLPSTETIQDMINASFGIEEESWEDSAEDEPVRAKARKVFEDGNPQGKSDHSNMHFAMQHLRQPGFAQVRILQKADRSLAWFQQFFSSGSARANQIIELGKAEDLTGSKELVPVFTTPEAATHHPLPDFHHLNFLYEEVKNKSATPPEVSLWAALTHTRLLNEKQGLPWACSTKAILIAQAWHYVDPYSYSGPVELLMLQGTALRDAVTGYVDKVYDTFGTWGYDYYDEDENVPKIPTEVQGWCRWSENEKYEVVRPFHMGDGDITITRYPKPITELRKLLHYIPSTLGPLRIAYDIKKAAEILASIELPEATEAAECAFTGDCDLSEEEIKADNDDFYDNDSDSSDIRDEALDYADASNEESLVSEEHEMSEEEADALAAIRKQEWLAEWSDSPDRVRNQLMNPTATPGMFKHRLITDEEQTPSEAPTELDMDQDYYSDVGTDYNDHHTDELQAMDHAAVPLATDVVFESSDSGPLETVIEEEDEDQSLAEVVPQDSPIQYERATSNCQDENKITTSQAPDYPSAQSPMLDSDWSSTSSAEIEPIEISCKETLPTPLSHVFPFLLKDASLSPEAAEILVQTEPAQVLSEATPVMTIEVAGVDNSLECDKMPMPSFSHKSPEDSAFINHLADDEELEASPTEIHSYQISDVETPSPPLSHIFPFLLGDTSSASESLKVHNTLATISSDPAPTGDFKVTALDTSFESNDVLLAPTSKKLPQSSTRQKVTIRFDSNESKKSSAEVDSNQISNAETLAAPLSHVFPFLAKNDSPKRDSPGVSAVEPDYASPTKNLEIATKDTPLDPYNLVQLSSSDSVQENSASSQSVAHVDESPMFFCKIDKPQISGPETSAVPLSHVFPFLLQHASTSQDSGEAQIASTTVSNDLTPAADTKASIDNTPPKFDDVVPPPSSSDDISQQPSSEDDSLQVVLYESRPHWFNILMLFARTLKRATNILHKNIPVEPAVTEEVTPHEVCLDIPNDLDLIPNRPDFNEFYFGKSTIYVGKQGIKVAKAAVQVGMLPVHAGVEVVKTPYKAAKTGWKIGNWAWSRFVRRC